MRGRGRHRGPGMATWRAVLTALRRGPAAWRRRVAAVIPGGLSAVLALLAVIAQTLHLIP